MSRASENVFCIWAQVSSETPWLDWKSKCFSHVKWPQDITVERWSAADVHWPKILDSCNSISLFKQAKVILIFDAEKPLKNAENLDQLLKRFKQGPHRIIFQSELPPPTSFELPLWKAEEAPEQKINEKAAFHWIDCIHQNQLTTAISALDDAIKLGQHPLALVQLITRDFRMGRLIHYAQNARIRESELSTALRVPGFVIQKWGRRQSLPKSQWANLFDRLLETDLELKSGADGIWALRKLTFDLIQLTHSPTKMNLRKFKRPLQPGPLLWTIAPSFA